MDSPFSGRVFMVSKRTIYFFGRVILWMFHIGRARNPGPGPRDFPPGQLSIEFVNVGGWLTSGDLALDSCAQFLAVAEHRLIPSRASLVGHQLRRAGHHSIWAPACQDGIAGGHAGVGVVSLGGAPLTLPSFATPQFQEFFRLGRVLRTTLPTSGGGVVHLFVVYGHQGADEDADQLQLTDKLLQAVLAEAQVVCIGQPMIIAGDLNADPAVIPVFLKVFLMVGMLIWLLLIFLVLVLLLMLLVGLIRRVVLVHVGIFLLPVLVLLLLLKLVMSSTEQTSLRDHRDVRTVDELRQNIDQTTVVAHNGRANDRVQKNGLQLWDLDCLLTACNRTAGPAQPRRPTGKSLWSAARDQGKHPLRHDRVVDDSAQFDTVRTCLCKEEQIHHF